MSLGLGIDYIGGPYSLEGWNGKRASVSPLVDVICNTFPSTQYTRDLSVMSYHLGNANQEFSESWSDNTFKWSIDIRNTWDDDTLRNTNETLFAWRDDVFKGINVLVGLTFIPRTPSQQPNVTVCVVNAKYQNTKLWYSSTRSEIVSSNFSWSLANGPGGMTSFGVADDGMDLTFYPINITKHWADVLNTPDPSSDTNATLLTNFLSSAVGNDSLSNDTTSHRITTALATAVVNGLSRIGMEYSVSPNSTDRSNSSYINAKTVLFCDDSSRSCREGAFQYSAADNDFPTIINGRRSDFDTPDSYPPPYPADGQNSSQILRKFTMPDDISDWTLISFPMRRYGYSWALSSALVGVAVAALLLHVVIVVVHCVIVLARDKYHQSEASEMRSLEQLVKMALESEPLKKGNEI